MTVIERVVAEQIDVSGKANVKRIVKLTTPRNQIV